MSLKERLQALLREYGPIALTVYLSLFVLTMAGSTAALAAGFEQPVEGNAESAGLLGAAYLLTQATKPVRIAATLALTPAVAALLRRFKRGA